VLGGPSLFHCCINRGLCMQRIIIVAILLISGCATTTDYEKATTANYGKILETWMGSPVDNLVISWGPPQSQYELSDGGKVIEYFNSRSGTIGGYTTNQPITTYNSDGSTSTTHVPTTSPSYNVQYHCRTTFDVDKYGTIISWRWEGNSCIAHDPDS